MEVESGHVEVSAKGIWEEEAVLEAPRLVLHPGVGDQTVAQLIGHVRKGIVAVPADIDGDVGDKGISVGVLWTQFITTDAGVGVEVVDIQGIGTDVTSGVSDANGSGVEYPQTTALVSLDAVDSVQADWAVLRSVGGPVRVRDQFRGTTGRPCQVDVVQCGGNTWRGEIEIVLFVS